MRKSVLIVEDNKTQNEMLQKLVLEVNPAATVYSVSDICTAYQILIEKTIDVFLVDIILDTSKPGDTSGVKLVERIRTIQKYMFTPVLFVTSLEDTTKYAFTDLNCLGYVEKPFSPEQVKRLVEKALNYSTFRDNDVSFCFRKDGVILPVKVRDIIYIESLNHVVTVNTEKGGTLTVPYKPCRDLLAEVDTDRLMQCSRNTIVNKDYIINVDIANRYIKLRGADKVIEIGVTFKKKVMREIGE